MREGGPSIALSWKNVRAARGHRLHVPFAILIRAISSGERIALLHLSRKAPPALTTSLMHILLGFAPDEIAGELSDMMRDTGLDEFVHAMIAKRNALRSTTSEGMSYDWVDEVIPV